VIVNDQLQRVWWRTAIALERIGLGVIDKNRSRGEYYVAPVQTQIDKPDPGLWTRWFGANESLVTTVPRPVYTVKLNANSNQTLINLSLFDEHKDDKDFVVKQHQYLSDLAKELQ
jgi:uncharacterized lipoprotein